jgi:uncharacterized protein YjbI with pentapeptide repeats
MSDLKFSMLPLVAEGNLIIGQTIDRRRMKEATQAYRGATGFEDCNFDAADLSDLPMSGFVFERCSFVDTSFKGATLDRTHWKSCRAGKANFASADLTEAVIHSGDFNNSNWQGATVASTRFANAKLTGASFVECRTLGLTFTDSLLINAYLRGISFRRMTLRSLDLSDADLGGADFRDSVFENCSLRSANLKGSRFQGADLRGADLGGLRLFDAGLFRGATISKAQAAMLLEDLGLTVA